MSTLYPLTVPVPTPILLTAVYISALYSKRPQILFWGEVREGNEVNG